MQHLTHTKKLVSIVGVITLICAGAYGYALFEIFETNTSVRTLESEARVTTLREDINRALRNALSETNEEREKLNALFLQEGEVVSFIEHLENLGVLAGVEFTILSIDIAEATTEQDLYEWLELSTTATGSWSNVYHLLALIESTPLALFVETVELSKQGGEQGDSFWTGRFDFLVAKKKGE